MRANEIQTTERERQIHVGDRRTERADDRNHQDVEGKSPQDIDDPHQDPVGQTAEIASDRTCKRAEGERQGDAHNGDLQVDLARLEDTSEHVAAEIVGAEPVLGSGRTQGACEARPSGRRRG